MRSRHACQICGGSFQTKRRDARLCSPKCRQRAARAGQDEHVTDNRTDSAPGSVTPLLAAPAGEPWGRPGCCRWCGLPLGERDPYRRPEELPDRDGMHAACAAWVASGRRHLLLEPTSWEPLLMAAA